MITRRIGRILAMCIALMFLAVGIEAQQTVYKWVDEDGVVHFGQSPPAGVEAERITTAAAPQAVPQQAPASAAPVSEPADAPRPEEPPAAPEPVAATTSIADMTLAELDQRCEAAREAKIAPLRVAEIERCKAEPRNDPAFCERHNADFGEGGRNVNGTMRPRMFDDLPACVEAQQERNRRPR